MKTYTELIQSILAGDQSGFDSLVTMSEKAGYRLAFRMTRDQEAAFDILQNAYLKAYQNLAKLAQPESFPSWFYGIVKHESLDFIRAKHETASIDLNNLYDQTPTPEHRYGLMQLLGSLKKNIKRLDPKHQTALRLKYVEGVSNKEIGLSLNYSEDVTKNILYRCLKKLGRGHQ